MNASADQGRGAARPPTIGLVGGVASGKSTVAAAWAEAGCVVCHSDDLGRRALEDPQIRSTLRSWWGPSIIAPDGRVDRSSVAAIVFADAAERRRLEALTHPWIEQSRKAAFAAAGANATAFVIDAPLLLEVGLDRECDAVVFVDAPRSLRVARVQTDRGWSEAELDRREAAQWPLDRKREQADHVLRNEGDRSSLHAEAISLLQLLLAEHAARQGGDASAAPPRHKSSS